MHSRLPLRQDMFSDTVENESTQAPDDRTAQLHFISRPLFVKMPPSHSNQELEFCAGDERWRNGSCRVWTLWIPAGPVSQSSEVTGRARAPRSHVPQRAPLPRAGGGPIATNAFCDTLGPGAYRLLSGIALQVCHRAQEQHSPSLSGDLAAMNAASMQRP